MSEQSKWQKFETLIERRYGDSINSLVPPIPDHSETFEPYEDDEQPAMPSPEIEDAVNFNGRLLDQAQVYNRLINVEVQLRLDEQISKEKVKQRALGLDGKVTGKYDHNPTTILSSTKLSSMMGQ